jgi:hypothetical protein
MAAEGRTVNPVSPRQATKLEALRRSEPSLLLWGQDNEGTIRFSVRARFVRGHLREPRSGQIDPQGTLTWNAH